MTVYVRTEEGQLAAYSPDSALPRKLRSLLKVIDGKTSVDVYVNSLRAFGDVRGVLKSLDMAGLIRPMSQLPTGNKPGMDPNATGAYPSTQWSETRTSQGTAYASTQFPTSASSGPQTQATYMPTRSAYENPDPSANYNRSRALGQAVDTMSHFILTNAPEQSFVILKELESLTNLEQLAVILGGYEQLIAHLGAPAQEHLLAVKQLLRENL